MFVVLIWMKTHFCEENLSNTQQNLFCKLQFITGVCSKEKLVWFSFFVFRHLNRVWKSNFDIQNPQNPILTFAMSRKILFWHSKFYFDIQNSILTFALSRKILFGHSKSYFDIRYESENLILIFKILFLFSFAMNRKILFWHSNFCSGIRTDSEKPILHSKSYCCGSENPILTFKVLFWHFPIYDFPTQFCIHKRIGFPGWIFGKAR